MPGQSQRFFRLPGIRLPDARPGGATAQSQNRELRKAIDQADLRVFYQPIVELTSGHICGVEAFGPLVAQMMRSSSGPADFIQVAEETGLIVPIGRFVLREVCRQAREWQMLFPNNPPLTTMVNISPRQFAQSDLVRDVSSGAGGVPESARKHWNWKSPKRWR